MERIGATRSREAIRIPSSAMTAVRSKAQVGSPLALLWPNTCTEKGSIRHRSLGKAWVNATAVDTQKITVFYLYYLNSHINSYHRSGESYTKTPYVFILYDLVISKPIKTTLFLIRPEEKGRGQKKGSLTLRKGMMLSFAIAWSSRGAPVRLWSPAPHVEKKEPITITHGDGHDKIPTTRFPFTASPNLREMRMGKVDLEITLDWLTGARGLAFGPSQLLTCLPH